MTLQQVLDGLGLMPFEEYRRNPERLAWLAEMQKQDPDNNISHRAAGRTTSMICNAMTYLSHLTEGEKVYIMGHRASYTRRLVEIARTHADKLGLDPMAIMPCYHTEQHGQRRMPNLFRDHY